MEPPEGKTEGLQGTIQCIQGPLEAAIRGNQYHTILGNTFNDLLKLIMSFSHNQTESEKLSVYKVVF